jgi:mutator protein MutT
MVEVAIALVWDAKGRILITRRPANTHLGGLWEFPGGKVRPGESPAQCAVREVKEEVGFAVEPTGRRPVIEHVYPERHVRLHPIDCRLAGGEGFALEVQELRWVPVEELPAYEFPPANASLLKALAVPVR